MSAPETSAKTTEFETFLNLVGRLNYTWTNTESLLIHMIAGLAGVTKEVATVIFLTLNTSRARLDLVERLAKLKADRPDLKDEILSLTSAMQKALKLKNKYNHCIYSFDNEGRNASTVLMRISDLKGRIEYGKTSPINTREIGLVKDTILKTQTVNRKLWDFFERHRFPV
ncbi:hypothetical protein [Roseibium sediminicola]|uniref:Uncharacterized protein n=1 Tax=Roseibium sediminicola TaxID=2933272 RepID=A0ABT0GW17_9HYPH|nr:hypothetical protein [Roseibium sp. CAU 1639]MCK7613030.1 hypothetical protein [Roseibium sp. CAU 1639]